MNLINLFRRGPNAADTISEPTQEMMLREAMQSAYTTDEATPDLRKRVSDMALLHAQQQVMTLARRPFSLRRCLLQMAVGASCALVALAVAAWPNIKTAYILYRMQSAIIHARTLSVYARYTVKTEKTPLHRTPGIRFAMDWIRVRDGDWHVESTHDESARFNGEHIYWNKSPSSANRKAHPLSVTDTSLPPPQFKWVGGLSLTDASANTAVYSLFSRLDKQREIVVNGRRMIIYVWTPPYAHPRTWMWLDADNYAPVQIEIEDLHSGVSVWRSYSMIRFGVDGPLQGGL